MPVFFALISGACFAAYFYLRGITQRVDATRETEYFEIPLHEVQKGDLLWFDSVEVGRVTHSLSYFEGLHRLKWRIVRGPHLGQRGPMHAA